MIKICNPKNLGEGGEGIFTIEYNENIFLPHFSIKKSNIWRKKIYPETILKA